MISGRVDISPCSLHVRCIVNLQHLWHISFCFANELGLSKEICTVKIKISYTLKVILSNHVSLRNLSLYLIVSD